MIEISFSLYVAVTTLVALLYAVYSVALRVKIKNLNGKHIVVTGGSSGIGKCVAVEAAKAGAHVTVVARSQNKLNDTLKIIKECASRPETQKITALSMDVTQSYDKTDHTLAELEVNVGPVDIFINCAGSAACSILENDSESNYRRMMELNFLGTVLPTKSVAKRMCQRGDGIIVVTSSMASLVGIYGMGAYSSSKWALRGFAETLYHEMAPHGVSVTLCLPPDTDTPGFEEENKDKPEETKLICQSGGIHRPEDVGKKLLSDALRRRFWSSIGLEGALVVAGCSSLSPTSDFFEIFLQISVSSLVRLLAIFNLYNMKAIIQRLHCERVEKDSTKKSE